MTKENLLEVYNLRTNFHTDAGVVQAVRGISFTVEKGESLGIVGESGCGKSVSMLSIMGLLDEKAKTESDKLIFNQKDLRSMSKKEMKKIQGNEIGMIFQDPMTSLNPLFTIGEQIRNPLMRHKRMTKNEANKKALELLELVGIPSPESRLIMYPHELSGGMRQRVMIAIAMSCDPMLLIADEPTTALDVTIQAQILDLMQQLKSNFKSSIVLITHDLGVIASVCSRILVMYGGIIVEEGRVDDIFYRTSHPYTAGLMNSLPKEANEPLIPINGAPPDLLKPPVGCPFTGRCKFAMGICKQQQAPLAELENGHKSACWLKHPSVIRQKGKVRIA